MAGRAGFVFETLGLADVRACNRFGHRVLSYAELACALDFNDIDARYRLRRVVRKRMGLEFVVERISLVADVLRRSLFVNLGDLQI